MNYRYFIPYWIKETINYVKTRRRISDNIILHKTSKIYPGVSIGEYSVINGNSCIFSGHVGRYCSIGYNVQISPPEHPVEFASTSQFFYKGKNSWKEIDNPTIIGNDVWIGSNAIVLSGVIIGTGAVIAAGAVVTKNVAPYTIVGGVPAKQLKTRFPSDIIEALLESKWWELEKNEVAKLNVENIYDFIKGVKEKKYEN